MIYLISDLHGRVDFCGLQEYCRIANKEDLLIILGDIGLAFEESEQNRIFTETFLSIDKNIAIVDGNHDNFAYLNSFPREQWNGGVVSRLTEHIVHLRRGNIYEIDGKSFFVFGGCKSSPKWKENGLWHEGEEPSEEELAYAYDNLRRCDYTVDYILTHKYEQTPPLGTVCKDLQDLTTFIEKNVQYRHWYAGHWHTNKCVDETHTLVYNALVDICR